MSKPLNRLQVFFLPFFLAVALLSLCPVPAWAHRGGAALARAIVFFPLVGALLGAVAAAVEVAAQMLGLPPTVAAGLALALLSALTGALHEDGLADCADGFGAAARDDKLRIMRDSRIGVYGTIALIVSFLLRASALAALPAAALPAALTLSRTAMPLLAIGLPPARLDGLGAELRSVGRGSLALTLFHGSALAAIALLPFAPAALIVAPMAALLAGMAVRAIARRQIGGFTGDVLGAGEQAVQIAVLLALATLAP